MTEEKNNAISQVLGYIDFYDGSHSVQNIVNDLSGEGHYFTKSIAKPEIERAVEECFANGWIKILSEQDCEEDRLRWLDDPHQNWSELPCFVGSVDFTFGGWEAFAQRKMACYNTSLEKLYLQSGAYIWRIPGRVSLLSLSNQVLLKDLTEVRTGSDCLAGGSLSESHTIGEITSPYAIGHWWIRRFYQVPYGFRTDISFAPADMHSQ